MRARFSVEAIAAHLTRLGYADDIRPLLARAERLAEARQQHYITNAAAIDASREEAIRRDLEGH